jgi:hypothetical protein
MPSPTGTTQDPKKKTKSICSENATITMPFD